MNFLYWACVCRADGLSRGSLYVRTVCWAAPQAAAAAVHRTLTRWASARTAIQMVPFLLRDAIAMARSAAGILTIIQEQRRQHIYILFTAMENPFVRVVEMPGGINPMPHDE